MTGTAPKEASGRSAGGQDTVPLGDFGSGTPGDQGTLSGVGEQPDGGGAGLGAVAADDEDTGSDTDTDRAG